MCNRPARRIRYEEYEIDTISIRDPDVCSLAFHKSFVLGTTLRWRTEIYDTSQRVDHVDESGGNACVLRGTRKVGIAKFAPSKTRFVTKSRYRITNKQRSETYKIQSGLNVT